MKKILFILGVLLIIYALASGGIYFFDYGKLSEYGQGFVVGKLVFLATGVFLIFLSQRNKR